MEKKGKCKGKGKKESKDGIKELVGVPCNLPIGIPKKGGSWKNGRTGVGCGKKLETREKIIRKSRNLSRVRRAGNEKGESLRKGWIAAGL